MGDTTTIMDFSEENNEPGGQQLLERNTISQPQNEIILTSNGTSTTQSRAKAKLQREPLPRKQSLLREEQNTVVNNFGPPRQSHRKIKLTTTNEDMSYENMPRIQTVQFQREIPTFIANNNIQTVNERVIVPTITKEHKWGNIIIRCSVKNCFNAYSKGYSFFSYPKNIALRKKWIKVCGLDEDHTEKFNSGLKVCRSHFEDYCFTNLNKKNRLRSDAVPSLFLCDNANIPSTSSASLLSTSCADVESEITPLMVNSAKPDSDTAVLRTHKRKFKKPKDNKADKQLPTKKLKNALLLDANIPSTSSASLLSTSCADVESEITPLMVNSAKSDSDTAVLRTHKRRFKKPKDNKADKQLSTKKLKNVLLLDNTDKCFNTSMSIDNFSSIDSNLKQKLKTISANNSLSITLEQIQNSKAIKPSVNSLSKILDENCIANSIQPVLKQNLSSRTNNSYPSIGLIHSLPSTSSSVYNVSEKCLLQYKQEATSNSKIPDKLSSNTTITIFNSSKLPEIKIPVVSKCISLARKTNTYDLNSYYGKNTSQLIIIEGIKDNNFKEEDNGFIFEITKHIELPNLCWKSVYYISQNATSFYQKDNDSKINLKEIHFFNSLVPVIKIHDQKYEFNDPITSKNKLKILLEVINSIEKGPDIDQIKQKRSIEFTLKHIKLFF